MRSHVRFHPSALLSLFVVLALLLPALPPVAPPAGAAPQAVTAGWTFLVYMAADNSLEAAGIDDFLEIATAGSDANLNIVVIYDRNAGDGGYGGWTETRTFHIEPGMTPDPQNGQTVPTCPSSECNMGDPQTAINFVNWARTNYPADRYGLIFWNHGGGWLDDFPRPSGGMIEDFCGDDTDGDLLTSAELYQILDTVTNGGTDPLDLVGFDACLMGMWEVDNQIKPFASAVNASSEELEPWDGWPYETIMPDLKANPSWSPAQLGDDITDRYYQSYGNDQTMSDKDLADAYTALNQAVDDLSIALIAFEPDYHGQFESARNSAQSFGGPDFIDLYDLAAKINQYIVEPELNDAATALMAAVDVAVLNERHGGSWPGAHGISFYFPSSLYNWDAYRALQSSQLTHWDEFVEYHVTGQLPCGYVRIDQVDHVADALTVAFTPTISGQDPISILWSFGDGITSTETNPVHTFPAYGNYTVTLGVGNCDGNGQDNWTHLLHLIEGCNTPVEVDQVDVTVDDRTVSFQADVNGEPPISYEWNFGDGQRSNEPNPVHIYTAYGTYTATLALSNCNGLAQAAWQEPVEVRDIPCALLVDDDADDPDLQSYYTTALDALGLEYEVWDLATQGSPSADVLQGHRMVLWYTGAPWGSTFTGADEAAAAAYLEDGGNLFLSSEDYLYDFGITPFGQEYLGIATKQDDVNETDPVGVTGNPIGDGLGPYNLTPPQGWTGSLYTDQVSGVSSPFRWQASGQTNSTNYEGANWKTAFLAWPLEGLADVNDRAAVLGRVVDWFGGCVTQPELVVQPTAMAATLAPDEVVTQTLWITNAGNAVLTLTLSEYTRTVPVGSMTRLPVGSWTRPERPRSTPVVDPQALAQVQSAGRARVIVYLRALPDLSRAYAIRDWAARGRYVYDQLQQTARRSGGQLQALLEKAGAAPRVLLTANAIAATVDANLLDQIAARPEVASIGPNAQASIIPATPEQRTAALDAVGWNLAQIRADQAWATFGITGTGATIGEIDTGISYTHPALLNQYRGNLGGGNLDHNYNWYDATGTYPSAPNDGHGHGTMVIGVAVGDDGAGNQIGVAPGAKWIAFKALTDNGGATMEDLHMGLQWMMAPTDLNNANPRPDLRPQIGVNSWGTGGCTSEFEPDLQAWRAAGMLPVFAVGSEGSGCGLTAYPAASPEASACGATDHDDNISFSARGPSCLGGIKPDVVAPGVDIRSSFPGGDYQIWDGTSFATPHLAGVAALVYSADPTLDGSAIENIITSTALCRTELYCGGTDCHNNGYGWGRIDAFEALSLTLGGYTPRVDVPWLDENPVSGTLAPGESVAVQVTFDATGMADGVYRAGISVASNDPILPELAVPITMTVFTCDPPTEVDFDWQPPTPVDGQLLTLTASAAGTTPIDFAWDLGDGNDGAGQEIVHSYAAPGTYTVVLTATNCAGVEVTAAHTVTVLSSCDPVRDALFAWRPMTPTIGEIVTLAATAIGTGPINFTWSLGDGTTATGETITHTYAASGTFTILLTATNGCGQASAADDIIVLPLPPACDPVTGTLVTWLPLTPTVGEIVTLAAGAAGTAPITFTWSFGDGLTGRGPTITHAYATSGTFTVALTATNGCGVNVVTQELVVLPTAPEQFFVYLPLVLKNGEK